VSAEAGHVYPRVVDLAPRKSGVPEMTLNPPTSSPSPPRRGPGGFKARVIIGIVILGAGGIGGGLLAGCGSSGSRGKPSPSTTSSSAPAGAASTTTTVVITTTTTHATTTPTGATTTPTTTATQVPAGFTAAKQQWVEGSTAISADQDGYFSQAASDLTGAINSGATNVSGYQMAVQELQQLASLPDADLTPTQNTEFQNDTSALNTFFGTQGLYQ